LIAYLRESLDAGRIEHWRKVLELLGDEAPTVSLVAATDSSYPRLLHQCYDRPPFLFLDGEMDPDKRLRLAIVGSRDASETQLGVADRVATLAAEAGIDVVSGLARGIDQAAHRGALAAGGRTIAVVGHGIDYPLYPAEHNELRTSIARQGAVVSQFRPGSPPTRSSFPLRNRVISGLSAVSFLVEASERSGTRSEAEHALKQGRQVFVWEPAFRGAAWMNRWVASQPNVRFVSQFVDVIEAMLHDASA
jgi:DNA processing protein